MAVGVRVLELATATEAKAGTATHVAVTPAGLAGVVALATPASDGGLIKSGTGVLTLSSGGTYTLTVPATGTAALLETANVFTDNQTIQKTRPVLVVDGGDRPGRFAQFADGNAHQTVNISFDGSNWNLDDTSYPGGVFSYADGNSNILMQLRYTTAGTNPRTLTEVMRVNITGNVLVGTTTDRGYRLDLDTGAMRMAEMSAPSAPAANGVVVYAQDNGAGKTQLMALFASGAAQQIAIQP